MNNQDYTKEKRNNPDLLDLLIIILKYKWVIIGFLLLIYIITFSFFYLSSKKSPNSISPAKEIYYSECVIYSDDISDKLIAKIIKSVDLADKLKAKLTSRSTLLAAGHFLNLSAIRQTSWDEKDNKWITEQLYIRDGQTKKWVSVQSSAIPDIEAVATLAVKSQNCKITLRFSHIHPEVPQKALNFCLDYVSEFFRMRMLEYYKAQKDIYQKQLAHVQDPVLKGKLFEQYINLIEKDTGAKNMKFYGLEIIEPAFVPEKIAASSTSSAGKSKYAMIIALVTLLSFVISMSLICFIEYIVKMRKNDPERFNLINKYLRFR